MLTVAFPVYERKEYFKEALLSVIHQTVKCEIIVVDNFSSHSYFKEVCEEFNVTYFRNDSNIGLFPNWNKCMSLIKTEYGMIFQDDNIMLPNFVEEFTKSLALYKNIDLYFCDFKCIELDTRKEFRHKHEFPFGYMQNGEKVLEFGIVKKLGFPYAFIVKTKRFDGYYTECHGSNDWLWLYAKAKGLEIYGNNQCLFLYGSHPNQDSKNMDTHMKCMLSISYIYKVILAQRTDSIELKKLSKKRFNNVFFYFSSIASHQFLKSLKTSSHIYASFFKDETNKNFFYKTFSNLPFDLRMNIYRLLRRTRLIGAV